MQNHQFRFINIRGNPLFENIDIRTNENIYCYEKNIICGVLSGLLIIIIVYYYNSLL